MNIKRLTVGVASASLIASLLAPAAFADTVAEVSGNGAGSHSEITQETTNVTDVHVGTFAVVDNNVTTTQDTGHNAVIGNTGNGGTNVTSGNATSTTNVTTTVGGGDVSITGSCGCTGDSAALISGNGAWAHASVTQTSTNVTSVAVLQAALIRNKTKTTQKTGGNLSLWNTGNGTTTLTSGHATDTTNVTTTVSPVSVIVH